MAGPWEKYQAKAPAPSGGKPWEKYAAATAAAPTEQQGDAVGAAIEGFGNGASMGYLPQLQALAAKPIYAVLNAVTGQNIQPDSYVQERDANIARQEALAKSNPKSYYGGMVAGGISTAPVGEAVAAKVLPSAVQGARLAKAVGTGAVIGALQNPGDEKGVIDPIQAKERAKDAAIGGAIGGAVDIAARGISNVADKVSKAGDALETTAEKNALRSVGAQKPQMKKLIAKDKVKDVGRFIIDENIAPAGAGAEDIAANAQQIKDAAGKEISSVFDQIEKSGHAGTFDRKNIAQAMRDALMGDEDVAGSLHSKKVLPQLEELITDFESKPGAADARELLKLKGQYDKEINYSKKAMDLPALQKGYQNIRSTINEAINDRATALSNEVRGDLAAKLKAANKRYGLASTVAEIADNKLAQDGNKFFSLTDTLGGVLGGGVGAVHGGVGSIPGAVAGAAASKAIRTYGPSVGTKVIDAASKGMKAVGPTAGAAIEAAAPGTLGGIVADELAPAARQKFMGDSTRALLKDASKVSEEPKNGPEKWASEGLQNLKEHSRDPASIDAMKEELMKTNAGKSLLYQASDLKPGSKAMDALLEKIRKKYGNSVSGH